MDKQLHTHKVGQWKTLSIPNHRLNHMTVMIELLARDTRGQVMYTCRTDAGDHVTVYEAEIMDLQWQPVWYSNNKRRRQKDRGQPQWA
jgi:hypothetical protein